MHSLTCVVKTNLTQILLALSYIFCLLHRANATTVAPMNVVPWKWANTWGIYTHSGLCLSAVFPAFSRAVIESSTKKASLRCGTLETPINKRATLLQHQPIWHMEWLAHARSASDLTVSHDYFLPAMHIASLAQCVKNVVSQVFT